MRTRRIVWTGSGLSVAVLAAVVALTARGQDRPPTDPKYYPSRMTPPPPGLYPATYVRQGGQPATAGQQPGSPTAPATGTAPSTGWRLTQPVVAGPEGVRPVSASEPVSALPPPVIDPAKTSPGQLPPPMIGAEPPPAPKLPDPKPLNLGGQPGSDLPAPAIPPASEPATPPSRPAIPGASPVTLPPPPALPGAGVPAPGSKPTTPAPAATPPKPLFQEPAPQPAAAPAATPLPTRQAPSLTVDAVAPENVGVGRLLTYELVVRNVGTSAATNVRVEDELPAKCALVGSDPAAEATGDRQAWSLGTLEPGVERRIKVTVRPTEEGEIHSRATVSFATAVEAHMKVTRPKIAVAMTGPEVTRVGEKVPFTIKLSNTGTGTADRVVLQAKFSDGLAHPQGQVIEAELPVLAAGQTKTLSLEAVAFKAGAQTCTLTASADGNPAETAKAGVTLVEPMLQAKQTGPTKCLVKSEPTYQIELSNPGTAATDPVQVWAQLPAGFEFVGASDGGAYLDANRAVGWRLPALPAGGSKSVSVKLRAVSPAEGVIRTVATAAQAAEPVVQAGGVPAEPRPAGKGLEVKVETPVKAEGVPALRFDVADVEDPVEVGKEAVYEIRVVNQGTGACTNVQLVADLAEGTSAVGATGPTTGRATGQQVVFDPIPQLGVKAEAVYRVRVTSKVTGDLRFRVRMACDQIRTPVVKEENTRFYKE